MEDRKLNEKESLDLIARMIRNTQEKMRRNIGRPLLILGYLAVIVAIGVWAGNVSTGDYRWNFLWFLVPAIGWTLVFRTDRKERFVATYIDRIINYVWFVFGAGILIACGMSVVLWELQSLFFCALSLGMMTALIGLIAGVRTVAFSGMAGMAIAPVTLFLEGSGQTLAIAGMFVVLLIIPGHILSVKSKKGA